MIKRSAMSLAARWHMRRGAATDPAMQRLRTRLMTVFALLTVAPLVLAAIIALVVSISLAQRDVTENQYDTAAIIGNLLEQRWGDNLGDLRAGTTLLGQVTRAERPLVFDLLRQRCSSCRAIWLIDPAGLVLQQAPADAGRPILDPAMLVALARGQEVVPTDPSIGDTSPTLLLGLPVLSSGEVHGALVALLDLQQLGSWSITAVRPSHEGYSYVIDSSGRLIISPRPDLARSGRDLRGIPLVAAALAGRPWNPRSLPYTGLLLPDVNGVWYRMPTSGWYVLIETPVASTNADNWFLFFVQIGLLILMAGTALVLGRRLAATITHPIEQLQRGVARLQAGRWDQPLTVRRHDEIGHLAEAFNAMAQKLQVNHTTLLRRSDELALANRELQHTLAAAHAANAIKSQFVATISHELRTPLTSVLGFSDMLSIGLYGELQEEQQAAVGRIRESGQHLLQLINDLLDFSKLEAGRLQIYEDQFVLTDQIADVISTCAPEAYAKKLAVHSIIDPALPKALRGDPLRLRQILINLLSNAVKFTEQGSVTIRAWKGENADDIGRMLEECGRGGAEQPSCPRYEASEPGRAGDRLVIVVEDTGIGIAPEDQKLIFDEFRQVDASYTRSRGGTGLGLAITQRLVELMEGSISLVSSPGRGSQFIVTLPLKPATNAVALKEG